MVLIQAYFLCKKSVCSLPPSDFYSSQVSPGITSILDHSGWFMSNVNIQCQCRKWCDLYVVCTAVLTAQKQEKTQRMWCVSYEPLVDEGWQISVWMMRWQSCLCLVCVNHYQVTHFIMWQCMKSFLHRLKRSCTSVSCKEARSSIAILDLTVAIIDFW